MQKSFSTLALVGAVSLLSLSARAASTTFDFTYSGAYYGNSASATGTITFDPSTLTPGAYNYFSPSAFSLTVTGAGPGNGTFGLSDYAIFFIDENSGNLNFAQQLIGQPTGGNPYGTTVSNSGDFNFFSNGSNSNAPDGENNFTLRTSGGDDIRLTSFAPATPEPGSLALLATSGLGVLGLLVRKRRQ